jgi:hypothetical protein
MPFGRLASCSSDAPSGTGAVGEDEVVDIEAPASSQWLPAGIAPV